MRFHIQTLKARSADAGQRLTWQDIAESTGIRKPTLLSIANNRARAIRPEYVDALCTFFGVTTGELMSADQIDLPLNLNLRPDRRGRRIDQD